MHIGLEKTEKINLARVKPARDRDRLGCFIPHLFDPGLLYQASHKNIELCKINIFYLHKISVFKKYV